MHLHDSVTFDLPELFPTLLQWFPIVFKPGHHLKFALHFAKYITLFHNFMSATCNVISRRILLGDSRCILAASNNINFLIKKPCNHSSFLWPPFAWQIFTVLALAVIISDCLKVMSSVNYYYTLYKLAQLLKWWFLSLNSVCFKTKLELEIWFKTHN